MWPFSRLRSAETKLLLATAKRLDALDMEAQIETFTRGIYELRDEIAVLKVSGIEELRKEIAVLKVHMQKFDAAVHRLEDDIDGDIVKRIHLAVHKELPRFDARIDGVINDRIHVAVQESNNDLRGIISNAVGPLTRRFETAESDVKWLVKQVTKAVVIDERLDEMMRAVESFKVDLDEHNGAIGKLESLARELETAFHDHTHQ